MNVDLPENVSDWNRLNLIVELCLHPALLNILHNTEEYPKALPKDPKQLYQRMVTFKQKWENKLKNVIRKDQWDKILPISGESNSEHWDITIIKIIIQYENILQPPVGGWGQIFPKENDTSKAAYVWHAKDFRNTVKHCTVSEISERSTDLLKQIEIILKGLGVADMSRFESLKCTKRSSNIFDNVR